jgi:hypothetical protein
LVTEVDTGFQHFAHGNGHSNTPKVESKIQSTHRACLLDKRNTLMGLVCGCALLTQITAFEDIQKTVPKLYKALGL